MRLIRATAADAERICQMQRAAFSQLLEKYMDFETSPGNESVERVRQKLLQAHTYYYIIEVNNESIGGIRVVDPKDHTAKRISPLFILPEFRQKGYAQAAIRAVEQLHGEDHWSLSTILQERGNCRLYEKMGYRQTGQRQKLKDNMTIVFYEKEQSL